MCSAECTLCPNTADRKHSKYYAPLIDWNEAWAAVESANNFIRPSAIATRDVHIVTLARYYDGYRVV